MAIEIGSLLKKGFTPLIANKYAALSWQGEPLSDFWMWNGQITQGQTGRSLQTVRVSYLKEASVRFWRDKWVPLKWDAPLLRRMEACLRAHTGFKKQGIVFPDTDFLQEPEPLPADCLKPEIEEYLSKGSGN